MIAEDGLSFVLPFLLLIFAGAFLLVGRNGSVATRLWGYSYLMVGLAHLSPILLAPAGALVETSVADALFIAGFCLLGEAMLARFGKPSRRRAMFLFFLFAYGATAYALLTGASLRTELLLCDLGCTLPLIFTMAVIWTSVRRPIDRALFWLTGLVAADMIVRNGFLFLSPAGAGRDSYAGASYVAVMEVTATGLGLLFALTALAAVALDIIADYRDAAERDPLTGILNRRGFERTVRALGGIGPVPCGTVVLCDIDRFKSINDSFGHAAGDGVIVAIAGLLQENLPQGGIAARFGGEEFVAFLPDRRDYEAAAWAERVRAGLAARSWNDLGISRSITASFGVSFATPEDRSLSEAMARADRCLYAAKAEGRNRIVLRAADRMDPSLRSHLVPAA